MMTSDPDEGTPPKRLYELDDWLEKDIFVTPPGGEIVVHAIETFDYPYGETTPEMLEDVKESFLKVYDRARNRTSEDKERARKLGEKVRELLEVEDLKDEELVTQLDEIMGARD